MNRLGTIMFWVCVLSIISFFLAVALSGCVQELLPQPTFYSEIEKNIMFIPKGCRIGDIVAPEDGIFIGRSKIIDLQIIEVPVKKKQKKQLM